MISIPVSSDRSFCLPRIIKMHTTGVPPSAVRPINVYLFSKTDTRSCATKAGALRKQSATNMAIFSHGDVATNFIPPKQLSGWRSSYFTLHPN